MWWSTTRSADRRRLNYVFLGCSLRPVALHDWLTHLFILLSSVRVQHDFGNELILLLQLSLQHHLFILKSGSITALTQYISTSETRSTLHWFLLFQFVRSSAPLCYFLKSSRQYLKWCILWSFYHLFLMFELWVWIVVTNGWPFWRRWLSQAWVFNSNRLFKSLLRLQSPILFNRLNQQFFELRHQVAVSGRGSCTLVK